MEARQNQNQTREKRLILTLRLRLRLMMTHGHREFVTRFEHHESATVQKLKSERERIK